MGVMKIYLQGQELEEHREKERLLRVAEVRRLTAGEEARLAELNNKRRANNKFK
jgi:hypothetical protein